MFGIKLALLSTLSRNLRAAVLFIMFLSSSAFAQDTVSCEGGLALPIGAFYLDFTPPGCDGMPGFVKIGNGSPGVCMAPLIGGLDSSQISITTGDGLMGNAIEARPDAPHPDLKGIADCFTSTHYVSGFAGHTNNVSVGAEGYTFAYGSSPSRAPVHYKSNGAPYRVMNILDPLTPSGLGPSVLGKEWSIVAYDTFGNGVHNGTRTHTPYFLFDETNRSR